MKKINRINNILLFVLFLMIVGLGFNLVYSFNSFFYVQDKKVLGAVEYKDNFILNNASNISIQNSLISKESIILSTTLTFEDNKRNDEFNLLSVINKEDYAKAYSLNCSFDKLYFRVNLLIDGKEIELSSNKQVLIKVNPKSQNNIILKAYRITNSSPDNVSVDLQLINL